jgi:ribosomal protein S18 acetylase RimI-like enzyme
METRPMRKSDFDHVVEVIDHWWGGPGGTLAHPMFFYELGELATVAEEDGRIVGFLFGFISTQSGTDKTDKTGYVHLVGIHPDFRRRAVGRLLYEQFLARCTEQGCRRLKAIATLGNDAAIRFHEGLGFVAHETEDYAGPSRKRIVFLKELTP